MRRGEYREYSWHTSPSVQALILPPKAPLFRGTLDIGGFRLAVSRGRTNASRAETAPSWGIIIVGQAVLLTAVNGDGVCNWGRPNRFLSLHGLSLGSCGCIGDEFEKYASLGFKWDTERPQPPPHYLPPDLLGKGLTHNSWGSVSVYCRSYSSCVPIMC